MSNPVEFPEVEVRSFRPDDEAEVLDCLRVCFDFEPDATAWRHLMLANPAGAPIMELALHGGRVVAHLAVVPRRIRAFGEDGIAGQWIDAMTLPAWRRRGLRVAIGARAREISRARGFIASFGYSNHMSLPGVLKHDGRSLVGSLPALVRPLRPLSSAVSLAARMTGGRWQDRAEGRQPDDFIPNSAVARVEPWKSSQPLPEDWRSPAFDEGHTAVFRGAEGIAPIAFVRDADHLAWRYQASGNGALYLQRDVISSDQVEGTAVVRLAQIGGMRLVMMMEWIWRTGARAQGLALLSAAVDLARAARADGVAALAAPGSLQRRLLIRHGFLPVPRALFPKTTVLSVQPGRDRAELGPWVDRANWYTTWGDGFLL